MGAPSAATAVIVAVATVAAVAAASGAALPPTVVGGTRAAAGDRSQNGLRVRGEAIFSGRRPVSGRIRGHESDLPPEVVACRQCHLPATADGGVAAAPVLDRKLLLQPVQRRGGPPSVYDLQSFCKLLRTGIDPAYVLIDRIMPAYAMSDTDCAALWQVLTR
jgi:hypothetical protein